MSKDVYLLRNIDDYNKHVNHLGFWTEFLSGVHRSIDLVIINFYPFKEILKKTIIEKKIIDNIDIGGPTIARAAAKNFKDVVVMTDTDDYCHLAKESKQYNGKTSLEFRKQMANKAFNLTAFYDAIIAEWFNQKLGIKFPKTDDTHISI